jgi:flagellum-specific ATP synthase
MKKSPRAPQAPPDDLAGLVRELRTLPRFRLVGRVSRCGAGIVACGGLAGLVGIGDLCRIERRAYARHASATPAGIGGGLPAEVVGFHNGEVLLMPYGDVAGIARGATVTLDRSLASVRPGPAWQGRVVDPFARPLDDLGPLPPGPRPYAIHAQALPAHRRRALGPRLDLGVRAMNLFAPCRRGQRMGVFAGSGVGKSMLLSMIARHSDADALVIGLIGERGREVGEFLGETLGPEGRARSVVVVATSDQPAMMRRRAAHLTMAIAEALRDEGLSVLCLMDSVTRFAMALREIHLAAGEAPTSKGYPPSVFAELPRLLERAGPGEGPGSITGLLTVLVEGDDTSEPVADAVRGILDGHVVLDRAIAEGGRFPAMDVLRSLSRTAPAVYEEGEERGLVQHARRLMRAHADMDELIRLGAYRPGSDALIDEAIARRPALEALLAQDPDERASLEDDRERLRAALEEPQAA